jgi:hypothetical protein
MPKPYLTHQAMFDPAFVPGRWHYLKHDPDNFFRINQNIPPS